MSISNPPLSNAQTSQAYTEGSSKLDFEGYESFEDTEFAGWEDDSDSHFQWNQESSGLSGQIAPNVDGLRVQLAALEKQLKAPSALSAGDRQQLNQEIQQIKGLLNRSQGFVSPDTQQQLLSDATRRLSAVEALALGTDPQIAGETAPDFEAEEFSEGQSSTAASHLASQLRVDAETLMEAAQGAGLDIDHLPKTPDDRVMNFLNNLGVPSAKDLAEYLNLRDQRKIELNNLNSKADSETSSWRADSENVPSVQTWKDLYKYFKKDDSYSVQMQGVVKKMENSLTQALETLGYQVSASSTPGHITVAGIELDFLNEDSGNYKLDDIFNELTDPSYSPAPRNTEAGDFYSNEPGIFWKAVDGPKASGNKFIDTEASSEGYPVVSFASG